MKWLRREKANYHNSCVMMVSSEVAIIIYSLWLAVLPSPLFSVCLAFMQINKTLYSSIFLKWYLNLFFLHTPIRHSLLIYDVVLVLACKLNMAVLLGTWDSLFPVELFGCNVVFFPWEPQSNLKICILIVHYYLHCSRGFVKRTLMPCLCIFKSQPCSQWIIDVLALTIYGLIFQCFWWMVSCGNVCGEDCDL